MAVGMVKGRVSRVLIIACSSDYALISWGGFSMKYRKYYLKAYIYDLYGLKA